MNNKTEENSALGNVEIGASGAVCCELHMGGVALLWCVDVVMKQSKFSRKRYKTKTPHVGVSR